MVQVNFNEMLDAANAAQSAAAGVKGRGSSGELTTAAGAVTGASSVGYLGELGTSWDDEIAAWVTAADGFGSDLAAAGEDYRSVDASMGGLFGGLGGLMDGGS